MCISVGECEGRLSSSLTQIYTYIQACPEEVLVEQTSYTITDRTQPDCKHLSDIIMAVRRCTHSWAHPPAGHQLTVAVGPLHVVLHVALLGKSDAAQLTLEGLLPCVFDHMDLQSALLIEGLVTLIALEGSFACTTDRRV